MRPSVSDRRDAEVGALLPRLRQPKHPLLVRGGPDDEISWGLIGDCHRVLRTFPQISGLKRRSWPVGRVLSPRTSRYEGGDHPSTTAVADGLLRSTRVLGRAALGRTLFDLAPGGVCRAGRVAPAAGGLLHHRFTLAGPDRSPCRRSVLCGTFPRVIPGGCCPPPCPAEPGPSSTDALRRAPRSPGQLLRTGQGSHIGGPSGGRACRDRRREVGLDHRGISRHRAARPPRGGRPGAVCGPSGLSSAHRQLNVRAVSSMTNDVCSE